MAHCDENTGVNDKALIQDVSTDEDEDPPGDADRRAYKVTAGEDLRKLEELGNSGLQAEYRGTRCRDCQLCKDAELPVAGRGGRPDQSPWTMGRRRSSALCQSEGKRKTSLLPQLSVSSTNNARN